MYSLPPTKKMTNWVHGKHVLSTPNQEDDQLSAGKSMYSLPLTKKMTNWVHRKHVLPTPNQEDHQLSALTTPFPLKKVTTQVQGKYALSALTKKITRQLTAATTTSQHSSDRWQYRYGKSNNSILPYIVFSYKLVLPENK